MTFLQRTFTSLVHAHAGRTQGQARRRLFRCGFAFTTKPRVLAALIFKGDELNKGRAFLLTGKVASGKTTYARKIEADGDAVFLSIDELQLSIFGSSPTREELDNSYEGARTYQFNEALKFLNNGIDVLFDWGLWNKSERQKYRKLLESHGFEVEVIYFKVSDETRMKWNAYRNSGNDNASFKIEPHDVKLFDSMYEEPSDDEYDHLVAQ